MSKYLFIALSVIILITAIMGGTYVDSINYFTNSFGTVADAINSINGVGGALSDRLTPSIPLIDGVLGSYHDTSQDIYVDVARYLKDTYVPNYENYDRFNSQYSFNAEVSTKLFSYDVSLSTFSNIMDTVGNQSKSAAPILFTVIDAIKFEITISFPDLVDKVIYNVYIGKPIYNTKHAYNPPDLPYIITINVAGEPWCYTSTRYNNVSEFLHTPSARKALNGAHFYSPNFYTTGFFGDVDVHQVGVDDLAIFNITESTRELKDNFELFYEME